MSMKPPATTTGTRPGTNQATPPYNYDRFKASDYELVDFPGPKVGEAVPDFEARDPTGKVVRLSDFMGQVVVIETGSVTCPMYVRGIPAMQRLRERHPEVVFAVLYVREAHPGERRRGHRDDADKAKAVEQLLACEPEGRQIWIDDVDGSAHASLGSYPNMHYIIGRDGRVRFRSDWANTKVLEQVLAGTANEAMLRRDHHSPSKPAPIVALRTLFRGGWLGIWDFVLGLPNLILQHRRANRAVPDK